MTCKSHDSDRNLCYNWQFLARRQADAGTEFVYAYLTITLGSKAGTSYLLDPKAENRIGRGSECEIELADALMSRVHAILAFSDNRWMIRDDHSRNGSFVNETKIDEAALADGHCVRIGSTEFSFHESEQPPTVGFVTDFDLTQTIVRDTHMNSTDMSDFALSAIRDNDQARDLLLLYQLSIKLLGCHDPNEVVQNALELLYDRAGASVVAFLWVDDEGNLRQKMVLPEEDGKQLPLNQALTRLVSQEGHAVWIANQQGSSDDAELEHYADALCVPLLEDSNVVGAIHAYLDRGRFRQSQFDFAISVANITAVALVRARKDESLQTDFARLKESSPGYDEIVGDSPVMKELKSRIERLGATSGCVLIRGESGVGKELVARALHHASPRRDRPMLSVNCAALPEHLMESQLFGHKAGAFTGADRDHDGYFKQADLGTLFLDEVGEMTLQGQAKMLRVLEGHPFLPVGGTNEVHVDVRIIAATNQNLLEYVREKKFREDLYYRLSVFELDVPPLRERGPDIAQLVEFFLRHFGQQRGRPNLELSDEALEKLMSYQWPGNVRQLRNVMDSAVVLAAGDSIQVTDLGLRDAGGSEFESLRIDHWERRLIGEALKRTDGNVPDAAKLLGIGRATLYRKIDDYGIKR